MTNDPLDAMKARWNHIQGSLFPWLREEVDPITEALGRLVTTLDVIGLEAFVPEPPRGPDRFLRALAPSTAHSSNPLILDHNQEACTARGKVCYFSVCYFCYLSVFMQLFREYRFIGNGEVDSSILSGSTILCQKRKTPFPPKGGRARGVCLPIA